MKNYNTFNYDLLDDEDDFEYAEIKPVCKHESGGWCKKIFGKCEYKTRVWTNPDFEKNGKSKRTNSFFCMLAI